MMETSKTSPRKEDEKHKAGRWLALVFVFILAGWEVFCFLSVKSEGSQGPQNISVKFSSQPGVVYSGFKNPMSKNTTLGSKDSLEYYVRYSDGKFEVDTLWYTTNINEDKVTAIQVVGLDGSAKRDTTYSTYKRCLSYE